MDAVGPARRVVPPRPRFEHAHRRGDAGGAFLRRSPLNLALLHLSGERVDLDERKAHRLFTLVARNGNLAAQSQLGLMHDIWNDQDACADADDGSDRIADAHPSSDDDG